MRNESLSTIRMSRLYGQALVGHFPSSDLRSERMKGYGQQRQRGLPPSQSPSHDTERERITVPFSVVDIAQIGNMSLLVSISTPHFERIESSKQAEQETGGS
jgi:hypothetical protein